MSPAPPTRKAAGVSQSPQTAPCPRAVGKVGGQGGVPGKRYPLGSALPPQGSSILGCGTERGHSSGGCSSRGRSSGAGSHLAAMGAPRRPQSHLLMERRCRAQPTAAPLPWVPRGHRAALAVPSLGCRQRTHQDQMYPKSAFPPRVPGPHSSQAAGPTFHGELGLLAGWPGPGPAGAGGGHGITAGWRQRERRRLSTVPRSQSCRSAPRGSQSSPSAAIPVGDPQGGRLKNG